ncbi:hypothetical protein SAMN04488002_2864 [Litoreibacter janthinus]|uniref:Uncharacterized protein n=1 Tax=Litoreibacter janthinus TaxID=670154 RepID=A0A1I6HDC5_9RHOB|nr:hypothetical protein SAMN04488002_2864 [Litoreibacter janthinus]
MFYFELCQQRAHQLTHSEITECEKRRTRTDCSRSGATYAAELSFFGRATWFRWLGVTTKCICHHSPIPNAEQVNTSMSFVQSRQRQS